MTTSPRPCCSFKKMVVSTLFISVACSAHAGKATADLSGLDDETRALVAKERARVMMIKSDGEKRKEQSDKASSSSATTSGSSDAATTKTGKSVSDTPSGLDSRRATVVNGGVTGGCDINIGNTESRPGLGSARPKPVIITGPVVQLCNK